MVPAREDGIYRQFQPCECVKRDRQESLRKNCGVPGIYEDARLNAFLVDYYSQTNRPKADYALKIAASYIEQFQDVVERFSGRGLYFQSDLRGSGKTMLAAIIVNELVEHGIRAKFVGMAEMLQSIKDSFDAESGESSAEIIGTVKNVPILVLDDIGVERQTTWVEETVYGILDYRISNGKVTFFTSNTEVDALKYDERIKNRITRMALVVKFPEESVRLKIARAEDRAMKAFFGGVG